MIEAEIKARLQDPDAVRARLGERARRTPEVYRDAYFDTPGHDLGAGDRELRVRTIEGEAGARHILTYKDRPADEATQSKPEVEIEVSDPDAAAEILHALGFPTDLSFTKDCENYRFSDGGRDFLATLVTVPEVDGTFLEVETQTPKDKLAAGLDAVRAILAELGVNRSEWTTETYTGAVRRVRSTPAV